MTVARVAGMNLAGDAEWLDWVVVTAPCDPVVAGGEDHHPGMTAELMQRLSLAVQPALTALA